MAATPATPPRKNERLEILSIFSHILCKDRDFRTVGPQNILFSLEKTSRTPLTRRKTTLTVDRDAPYRASSGKRKTERRKSWDNAARKAPGQGAKDFKQGVRIPTCALLYFSVTFLLFFNHLPSSFLPSSMRQGLFTSPMGCDNSGHTPFGNVMATAGMAVSPVSPWLVRQGRPLSLSAGQCVPASADAGSARTCFARSRICVGIFSRWQRFSTSFTRRSCGMSPMAGIL